MIKEKLISQPCLLVFSSLRKAIWFRVEKSNKFNGKQYLRSFFLFTEKKYIKSFQVTSDGYNLENRKEKNCPHWRTNHLFSFFFSRKKFHTRRACHTRTHARTNTHKYRHKRVYYAHFSQRTLLRTCNPFIKRNGG